MIDTTPRPAPAEAAAALLALAENREGGVNAALRELTQFGPLLPAALRRPVRDHLIRLLRSDRYHNFPPARAAQHIANALEAGDFGEDDHYQPIMRAIMALAGKSTTQWRRIYDRLTAG